MKVSNLPWKPVVTAVVVVLAREVGVRLFHLAVGEWIKSRVREKLNVVKREFGVQTDPEPSDNQRDTYGIPDNQRDTPGVSDDDIQNGVDPNEARRQAAQRRDESGRFTKDDENERG